MTVFTRHSERVPPQGAAAGDVAERALGKHKFSPWELLLRETFQNSWDARSDRDHGHINYEVNLYRANAAQCELLSSNVFGDLVGPHAVLRRELENREIDLLIVSDSGTRGLGGPMRGDVRLRDGERADYADFILHVGRAAEKEVGGGTFGFGKAVFPLASRHGVCLVYTQAQVAGALECRLVAFGVGRRFEDGEDVYTGRHWWGVSSDDEEDHVFPLQGDEATRLARALGMDTMGPHRTGTSIAIVGPELYGDNRRSVVEQISDAALRWIWPHLVDRGDARGPNATLAFQVDGEEVSPPEPMKDPVMQYFARALRDAEEAERTRSDKDGQTSWARVLDYARARRHLGSLAVQRYPDVRVPAGEHLTHHVALMRGPRLVVEYLEVKEPGPEQALAGVFIATDSLDKTFAKAEPPAHDVWQFQGVVSSGEDNPVRIALRKIQESCTPDDFSFDAAAGDGRLSGIANVARRLGVLFGGVEGPGAELEPLRPGGGGGGGGGSGARSWHPSVNSVELRRGPGGPEVDFVIPVPATLPQSFVLRAVPRVVIHGGSDEVMSMEPDPMPAPEFVGWFNDSGDLVSTRTGLPFEDLPLGSTVRVRITQPPMTAVRVDLKRERA